MRRKKDKERRLPRSRKELRESVTPAQHVTTAPTTLPPVVVVTGSGCLHSPHECSVYRYPPQWCSSCQVRAASQCAQNGLPDVRPLFRPAPLPCVVEYGGACSVPPIYRPTMCPTSVCSAPSYVPSCAIPAALPSTCALPPRSACCD